MLYYAQLPNGRYIGQTTYDILKACEGGADYAKLEKATGSSRGSLHVMVRRLKADKLLRVRKSGTSDVVYTTRKAGLNAKKC